jgi:hypothetical protein
MDAQANESAREVKCRSCRLASVVEPGDRCAECTRRVEQPAAGDGCAIQIGSDLYPATVSRVTRHTIVAQWDREHGGGLMTIEADGRQMRFVRNRRGQWVHRSYLLSLGARASHRDPSF